MIITFAFAALVAQLPEGPEVKPKIALNFGSDQEDAVSSFAMDKDGSFWVSGAQKGLADGFTYDWFVAKLSADGKPQWLRVYGGPFIDETMRHMDMAGEGNPRMMALVPDGSGAIVVGRSESGEDGQKSPHMAVVFKVKPDGSIAWSKAFRPGWENKMIQGAGGAGVTVVGKRAYVVGVTGAESLGLVSVWDTDTGEMKSAQGLDFGPTYNDRLFAVAADEKNKALWVGGWSGSGNKGIVAKLTLEDKPKITWVKRLPMGWASTIPDIALDTEGNAYCAGDVHGATNWNEAWKLAPDGKVVWRAKYQTGARADRQNTHAIAVFGDKVVVMGRTTYANTQTHSDAMLGDSLVLVLDKDGKKVADMFHFTGTQKDIMAMERARGAAMKGDTLFVAGNIWSEGAMYKGQWRKPADYKLPDTVALDTPSAEDVETKIEDHGKWAPKDPKWLKWHDKTSELKVGSPEEMSQKVQRSTQGYIYSFEKPW